MGARHRISPEVAGNGAIYLILSLGSSPCQGSVERFKGDIQSPYFRKYSDSEYLAGSQGYHTGFYSSRSGWHWVGLRKCRMKK